MSISLEQVEQLLAIARDASSGQTFDQRMGLLAKRVRAVIPHSATMFTLMPLSQGSVEDVRVFSNGLDPDVTRDYATHYHRLDVSHDLCRANLGKPILLSAVVPHDQFGKDEYTSDCLLRTDIRHILGGWIPVGRGLALQLTFARPPGSEDFEQAEVRLAQLIAQDLARAAFNTLLAEKLERIGASHADSRTGLLVFDKDGELAQANARAIEICRALDSDPGVHGDLIAGPVHELARASGALGRTIERRFLMRGHDWAMGTFTSTASGVVCLLEVLPPTSPSRVDAMVRSLGLTKRELEVMPLLLRGRANKEIARELGVAEITAKVHVSNIFRKAGVTCRMELMSWLLGQGE